MIVGLALFLATLILRGASANRHVRGRLLASAFAFAAYTILVAALVYRGLSGPLQHQIRLVSPLVAAFGTINALVALIVNPWRGDRLPDRFPTIVQDVIVIALFGIAAVLVLQERVFAATAVGAVVIGFALQDTLGNLFAGLAIQIDKPLRVGHWVRIGGTDGMVSEITWRATKMRTKAGNFVIVPNSTLARETVVNYSEPTSQTRVEVEVGASYDVPPNEVKATIMAAIKDEPLISRSIEPEILLVDFAASAMTYRIRVWTADFATDDRLRDRIRSAVYYAFRRSGIAIPYPIQVEIQKGDVPASPPDEAAAEQTLRSVPIFAALGDEELGQLARASRRSLFAAGEPIVRQGDGGSSMFVVARGEAVVTLAPGHHEVARIQPGGFFGEMSLLTGALRTATVQTAVDSELLEITGEAFRRFVLANPAAVEEIGTAVANRRAELDERRTADTAATVEPPQRFLDRVRRFLQLS